MTPKKTGRLSSEDVLVELALAHKRDGVVPSMADLSASMGIGVTGVKHHLDRLKRRGLLDWNPLKARTYTITEAGRREIKRRARILSSAVNATR